MERRIGHAMTRFAQSLGIMEGDFLARRKGQAIQHIAYAALATESTNCSPQTWLDRQEEAKRGCTMMGNPWVSPSRSARP